LYSKVGLTNEIYPTNKMIPLRKAATILIVNIIIVMVIGELSFRILSQFPKDSKYYINDKNIGFRIR